jgi:hypothetical protein
MRMLEPLEMRLCLSSDRFHLHHVCITIFFEGWSPRRSRALVEETLLRADIHLSDMQGNLISSKARSAAVDEK